MTTTACTRFANASDPAAVCRAMRQPCGMAPIMSLRSSRARAERAHQLRAVGWSWKQIAAELGYRSHGAVQSAVRRHELRETEPAESSRRSLVESARITTRVLFDRFAAATERGDDRAVALLNGELSRNRDQLARLTGAYLPERAEVDVSVSSVVQLTDRVQTIARRVDSERADDERARAERAALRMAAIDAEVEQ